MSEESWVIQHILSIADHLDLVQLLTQNQSQTLVAYDSSVLILVERLYLHSCVMSLVLPDPE